MGQCVLVDVRPAVPGFLDRPGNRRSTEVAEEMVLREQPLTLVWPRHSMRLRAHSVLLCLHSCQRDASVLRRLCVLPLQLRLGRCEKTREMIREDVEDAWTVDNREVILKNELVPTREHGVEARLRVQVG